MEILLVCVGGAAGSLLRYWIGRFILKHGGYRFPFGTFAVNISGAILLGAVSALNLSGSAWLLLAEGALGAYTTFSTFMFEGIALFHNNKTRSALIYIAITLVLGLAGFCAGFAVTQALRG